LSKTIPAKDLFYDEEGDNLTFEARLLNSVTGSEEPALPSWL
jgi:hypothetical protein